MDLAGQRAGDLLRAWVSGDAGRFQHELESILKDATSACDAGEEERRNLLRAVALRMKKCPDVFGLPRKAGIELCLHLLGHLTEEAGGREPEWAGKARYGSRISGGRIGNNLCLRLTYTTTGVRSGLRLV
jgi:hypothetical protein